MVRWVAVVIGITLAGCRPEEHGILIVTKDATSVLRSAPSMLDLYVGVDDGVPVVPLTRTIAFVQRPEPDDRDRTWNDPSQPYSILLTPGAESDRAVYVVIDGMQDDKRFRADLDGPVVYPGEGVVEVPAEVFPGDGGACPHGYAEEAGVVIEILETAAAIDCDDDQVDYGEECTDYDASARPNPHYPPSVGRPTPDALLCCNSTTRLPAQFDTTNGGPSSCNVVIGCAGARNPFTAQLDWQVGPGTFCECAQATGEPLGCLAQANASRFGTADLAAQPYCAVPVDGMGAVCPGSSAPMLGRFAAHLSAGPTCPIALAWRGGSVDVTLRSTGSPAETTTTDDCAAELVFRPAGPPLGLIPAGAAFGWYIVNIGDRWAPFHVIQMPVPDCEGAAPMCGFGPIPQL